MFSASFNLEDKRFQKTIGIEALRDIGWRIAGNSWFNWRELYRWMHAVTKQNRAGTWKYLRAAQAERNKNNPLNTINSKHLKPTGYFDTKINPFSYQSGFYPILLGTGRIGVTLKTERIMGNMARVYYRCDLPVPIELVSIEYDELDKEIMAKYGTYSVVVPKYRVRINKIAKAEKLLNIVQEGKENENNCRFIKKT